MIFTHNSVNELISQLKVSMQQSVESDIGPSDRDFFEEIKIGSSDEEDLQKNADMDGDEDLLRRKSTI